jgi:hypothetical protein
MVPDEQDIVEVQLISAAICKILLNEYLDDVDVFNILAADGVEQLCWGMKNVVSRLKGKEVEIRIDATCA